MIPRGASGKESAGTGDTGVTVLIPGLERSPGVENGNSLQYSSLENSTGREAWRATVLGQKESDTTAGTCTLCTSLLMVNRLASH